MLIFKRPLFVSASEGKCAKPIYQMKHIFENDYRSVYQRSGDTNLPSKGIFLESVLN